ncbi:MAG: MBL fold metallo-hydrolase [Chlamydiales bacterium]|nr:MBL fold metallo-hydrolase [Chlamydiales bacterium]
MIVRTFCFGPLGTNAILLACKKTRLSAVVDPGVGSIETLLKALQEDNLVLDKILLTHSHWDHIAGVNDLKRETKAPVYIHPLDRENLEKPGSDRIPLFFPIQGVQPDYLLQDQEILEIGHLQVEVLHTPGHSPGGVCFYLPKEHLLLSGDTLFRGGIGNLQLPTSSPQDMECSLEKLAALPGHTRVIPGHGKETTIGQEFNP